MNFGSLNCFLLFKKIEMVLKTRAQCWARSGPGLQPTRRGGLPRATGQQAGWALAWRLGPTEEATRGAWTGALASGWPATRFSWGALGGFPEGADGRRGQWAHWGNGSMGGGGAEAERRCSRVAEAESWLEGGWIGNQPWNSLNLTS
jgi:hypothetical protein